MGIYATTSSLPFLLPFALKGNSASDTTGVAIFSKCIDRAESVVNSFLATRYSMPFSPVPPVVATISEDLACCYFVRGSYVQDGQRENRYDEKFCNAAMELLQQMKDGKIPLTLTDGSLVPTRAASRMLSNTENYSPTFNQDEPTNWAVSSNRLDEIEGERN